MGLIEVEDDEILEQLGTIMPAFPDFEFPKIDSVPYVAGDRPEGMVPSDFKTDRRSYVTATRNPNVQEMYDSRALHIRCQRMN